jgi:hypothetical protein
MLPVMQRKLCREVKTPLFIFWTSDKRRERSRVRRNLLIVPKGDL